MDEADRTGVMVITTATSAGLGFVLGGPGGAAIGAVVPEIVRELTDMRVTNMKITLDRACNVSGVSARELISWVRADTAHAELVTAAVEAACETLDPDRLRVLGYVLAGGLANDAKIDNSRLLIDALRHLQPAHVSVLMTLTEAPSPRKSEVRTGLMVDDRARRISPQSGGCHGLDHGNIAAIRLHGRSTEFPPGAAR